MRLSLGFVITLGSWGSFPLLSDQASAASERQGLQETAALEETVNSSSSVSSESLAYHDETYPLQDRVTPSATLRVVDEIGRTTEIPIDFSLARAEPRGFWGDVAVNGLALFSASLCIILLKEALSWSVARRRKAKAKAQREMEARRRAAISAQLEAAEVELRGLRRSVKEGGAEGLEERVRRMMDLFDAYRQELKDYDAPALLAYLDNLLAQAAHLLRTHNTQETESEIHASMDANWYVESAPPPKAANSPKARLQREVAAAGASASTRTQQAASPAASSQAPRQTPETGETPGSGKGIFPAEVQRPDMDLVYRVATANPGMPPAEALQVARELTLRRRQSRVGEP
ncbi:hypothetical protein ACSSS7_000262 [Eimeria intestinalis]